MCPSASLTSIAERLISTPILPFSPCTQVPGADGPPIATCGHQACCHTPPMEQLGLVGAAAAGLWMIGVGAFMALMPDNALRVLRLTASTRTINNFEQGLRLIAGLAFLLRSPASKLPEVFEIAGWFVILSSLVLLALPLRWHSAYALWWADRFNPTAVRLLAPLSVLAGIGLIYAVL